MVLGLLYLTGSWLVCILWFGGCCFRCILGFVASVILVILEYLGVLVGLGYLLYFIRFWLDFAVF